MTFLRKFWGFAYCRGLNSPVLYQLSYRGIYLVLASKLRVVLSVPTATNACNFRKIRIVTNKFGEPA
jgi:hypothetical protein